MGFSSLRGRLRGLSGRKKVALLMTAAALGVAAATPWLFDDGTVVQAVSTGRNGGMRPRQAPRAPASPQAEKKPGTPAASPLPLPGLLSDVFDGRLQQTAQAPGGGEAGPGAGPAAAGTAGAPALLPGQVGLTPADFGNVRGYVAEPKR